MKTLKQIYLFFLAIVFVLLAYTYFQGYYYGPLVFGLGITSAALGLAINSRSSIPLTKPAKYLIGVILISIVCAAGANIHIALLGEYSGLSQGDVNKLWLGGFIVTVGMLTLASLYAVIYNKTT